MFEPRVGLTNLLYADYTVNHDGYEHYSAINQSQEVCKKHRTFTRTCFKFNFGLQS